jgi:hypothetical protein
MAPSLQLKVGQFVFWREGSICGPSVHSSFHPQQTALRSFFSPEGIKYLNVSFAETGLPFAAP